MQHFIRDSTGWHLAERVDTILGQSIFDLIKSGMAAAIAPDSSLHVVLKAELIPSVSTTNSSTELIYGTNRTGQWVFQKVVDIPSSIHANGVGADEDPRDLSLVIDHQDAAHIAYTPGFIETAVAGTPYFLPFSQLVYATNRSGTWTTQEVWQAPDGAGDAGLGESIALAPGDNIALASYYVKRVSTGSAQYSQLLYHTLSLSGVWNREVVAAASDGYSSTDGVTFTGYAPDLRFDAQGNPNVVFSDHASSHYADSPGGVVYDHEFDGQIRYAVKQGGVWNLATIVRQTDPLSQEMSFPEFAFSPTGTITFSGLSHNPGETSASYILVDNDAVGLFRQREAGVAASFTQSAENYSNFTTTSYQRFLHRSPDAGGLASWIAQMQTGLTDEKLEASLIASGEYIRGHGGVDAKGNPTAAWIQGLYLDVLGRPADSGGLSYWSAQLAAGVSPFTIALGFTSSGEREKARINADYATFLDRSADAGGLAAWVAQLQQGVAHERIQALFLASHEYFFGHGQGSEAHWINALYTEVLHRAPSTGELNSWIGVMGGTPVLDPTTGFQVHGLSLALTVTQGDENYRDVITAAYQHFLGRSPDLAGLNSWLLAMKNGLRDEQLEATLVASGEYIAAHGGTNALGIPTAAWVQAMYQDVLGRSADVAGLASWTGQLSAGVSPYNIALAFTSSGERERTRINADYLTLLDRPADSGGLTSWVSQLQQGIRHETIQAQLIASQEYFSGHGHSDASHWIGSIYQDILHRSPNPDESRTGLDFLTQY